MTVLLRQSSKPLFFPPATLISPSPSTTLPPSAPLNLPVCSLSYPCACVSNLGHAARLAAVWPNSPGPAPTAASHHGRQGRGQRSKDASRYNRLSDGWVSHASTQGTSFCGTSFTPSQASKRVDEVARAWNWVSEVRGDEFRARIFPHKRQATCSSLTVHLSEWTDVLITWWTCVISAMLKKFCKWQLAVKDFWGAGGGSGLRKVSMMGTASFLQFVWWLIRTRWKWKGTKKWGQGDGVKLYSTLWAFLMHKQSACWVYNRKKSAYHKPHVYITLIRSTFLSRFPSPWMSPCLEVLIQYFFQIHHTHLCKIYCLIEIKSMIQLHLWDKGDLEICHHFILVVKAGWFYKAKPEWHFVYSAEISKKKTQQLCIQLCVFVSLSLKNRLVWPLSKFRINISQESDKIWNLLSWWDFLFIFLM